MVIIKKAQDIPDHVLEDAEQISSEIVDLIQSKLNEGNHNIDALLNSLIWACALCIAPAIKKGCIKENAKMCGEALEKMILYHREKIE